MATSPDDKSNSDSPRKPKRGVSSRDRPKGLYLDQLRYSVTPSRASRQVILARLKCSRWAGLVAVGEGRLRAVD